MLLTVKNLKVEFKHDSELIKAVDGISFTVKENEILGIVGESGSGKTITALSVMDLLPKRNCFQSGEITCREQAAMVFQEPFTCLNPVLRAGEQIDEAVLVHKRIPEKAAKNETLDLLEKVKIDNPERIYNSFPHLLSGGERQRVMIAMALALSPKLLIADEPTTALDVTIQAGILDLILELRKNLNMSILFITHDFGIIGKVADRVLVMKEGSIIERGPKSEILSSSKADYTKKLLKAVPKLGLMPTQTYGDKYRPVSISCITVRNLSKTFVLEKGIFKKEKGQIEAVRNVNLEIKEGTTLGLVGESGSGKTTLGKLLIGLLKSDSGSVIYEDINNIRQIVFQDPYSSLDPRMRMGEIILEGPTIHGIKKAEKKEILNDVLFKTCLNYKDRLKYPHQFSGRSEHDRWAPRGVGSA